MARRVLVDLIHMYRAETGVRKFTEEFIDLAKEEKGDYTYVFKPSIAKIERLRSFRKSKKALIRIYCQFELILWRQVTIPILSFVNKADIIFFPDYSGTILPTRAKKVVVFHDTFFWDTPEHYGKVWGAIYRKFSIWSVRFNGAIFTISEEAKNRIKENLNVPMVPIRAIPHPSRKSIRLGVNLMSADVLDRLQLIRKEYFLHVGVFEKRKSLETLVRAFNSLLLKREGCQSLKLLLVGKRPAHARFDDYDHVIELIETLGLENKVVLPGYLSDIEIAHLYQNAKAYVFPSINEGFGIPILEAFAAGCPVIISNQKALSEVAGEACLRFPMKDVQGLTNCMELLVLDSKLGDQLAKKGRFRLKAFDRKTYMQKVERYFDDLLLQTSQLN